MAGGKQMNKRKYLLIIIFTCSLLFFNEFLFLKESEAFSPQVIQHGAVGEDVIELQARLQYIGFYNGKIDGVFGWSTYWALRNFQYEFGLDIDGMAGEKTKEMLVKATKYDEEKVKSEMYGTNVAPKQQGQQNETNEQQGQM